ncbi:MAG: cytochrome c3 family protein [bacterium]
MIRSVQKNFILVFVFTSLLLMVSFMQADRSFSQEVPESISIEHDIHRLDLFGPVHFGHQQHIELGLECKKCHHDWDENSYELPIACINCHGRDRVMDVVSLRTAYMKQCLGCHIIVRPDGTKTGPTICTLCHQHKQ